MPRHVKQLDTTERVEAIQQTERLAAFSQTNRVEILDVFIGGSTPQRIIYLWGMDSGEVVATDAGELVRVR